MKKSLILFLTLMLFAWVSFHAKQADAQSAVELQQRLLVASCANCHGTEGKGAAPQLMRSLNEQTTDALQTQLLAYRSGALTGTIMPQITKGYTEEQLKAIAQYLGKN